MMLVQKPPNLPSSIHHHHHHRRNPSAPVVVHPTRTPGLLSLSISKPPSTRLSHPQQQQQQQQRPHRSPKSKPAGPHNRSPKPAPAEPQQQQQQLLLLSEAETSKKAQQPTPGPSPDKHVRGRQQVHSKPAAVKDKITRSASPSLPQSAQVRRNNARQPSPPIQPTTSQAEGQLSFANNNISSNSKSNLFDPFIVSSDSDTDTNAPRPLPAKPAAPTPKLTNPSGRLARRRQRPAAAPGTPTPAPSKAVAVPRSSNNGRHGRAHSAMMNLSRSAPIASPLSSMGAFPVCDDTTDADGLTPPSTPTRKDMASSYHDGPRTAPLSSTSGFPRLSPTPSPSHRRRHHLRSPSEGMFSLSFDEDSSSSDNTSEELKMLFGLKPKRNNNGQGQNLRGMVHVSNALPASSSASKAAKAALYASSLFQNSPSPDELPPPAF